MTHPRNPIQRSRFDAALFDMDGVLTDTAGIHAQAWQQMFDEYLHKQAAHSGQPFLGFDIVSDYKLHVDGKPRYDGVRDFLRSRGIELPQGTPDDPPTADTVCGLGNRKDELVNQAIASGGVHAYAGSVELLKLLRREGIKVAVVTSSQNREIVLRAAGIADLLDAAVDGNTIAERHLAGKPAPDTYLEAAGILGVEPPRAVVIEDAISGVEAGRRGGFGLVIGVARKGNPDELRAHGAHLVVADLAELLS